MSQPSVERSYVPLEGPHVAQPVLEVRNLEKSFRASRRAGEVRAIRGVSFDVSQGEMLTLLGPSGCGKTTTLRSVAGLERPDGGEIWVNQHPMFSALNRVNVPANKRGLGMVFQSYAIWPHLDVYANVAFPLLVLPRGRRPSGGEIRRRVNRALEVVQLDGLASRRSTTLSGGQQQRLALARALVSEPPLLLLDEPLSNLDAKLREGMRLELRRLRMELGITSLYVTHDQAEALSISSRIAVMNAGSIEQVGTPDQIYTNPATRFVARFVGVMNFIGGEVDAVDGTMMRVVTPAGQLVLPRLGEASTGMVVSVGVRPEAISLDTGSGQAQGSGWVGRVVSRAYLGDSIEYLVDLRGIEVRVKCSPQQVLNEGDTVAADIDVRRAIVYQDPHVTQDQFGQSDG